jgi:hypothetical protein
MDVDESSMQSNKRGKKGAKLCEPILKEGQTEIETETKRDRQRQR